MQRIIAITIFFLALVATSYAAETRLKVLDGSSNETFSVSDEGTVSSTKDLIGNYATDTRGNRAMNVIGDAGGMKLWRVHDTYLPFMEFLHSTTSNPDVITDWWDISAGTRDGSTRFAIRDRTHGDVIHFSISGAGNVAIGFDKTLASPSYKLHVNGVGRFEAGVSEGSSREIKENIEELTTTDALETIMQLKPVSYNYKLDKDEHKVGFIAEDVPTLVATKDRKGLSSMDIVAVLTKVVQCQQETIDHLKKRLDQVELQNQSNSNF